MSARLEQATEDALLTGGRAGQQAVRDAGFSEDLKARLLAKLEGAQLESAEHAEHPIPDSAGAGTRHAAMARPWDGTEAREDAVRRMLEDAKPRLKGAARAPGVVVDMRVRRERVRGAGERLAEARDRVAGYKGRGEWMGALSDKEKEERRREYSERFGPGVRTMPATMTGLAGLANERIEEAMARGAFKGIPRGKGVERDGRADNPFIDTTEYILNNMIKRQDLAPPWIDKQQELLSAVRVFRLRLRNDWKRHASRMMASRGGSLQEQMARAEENTRAEQVHNPRRRKVEEITVPTNTTDDAVIATARPSPAREESQDASPDATPQITASRPFRDPDWEAAEKAYMELAISNLNSITRSYNLMAPELAKKPYFSLQRELDSCFAEVAPLIANEIKQRAAAPRKSFIDSMPGPKKGVLERFGVDAASDAKRAHESSAKHYGWKDFWKDFWRAPKT
ncbi:hypothetical protein B0T18DRAFT_333017 [Schizothecium vesticola]|uniref:DnaJ homologue subfamily C member 28 conserved domain-containing protein n=1 Tax=Schizothecium vesticola TaxID=314040 RepID=A0AA40JZB4_9PEZI|nr:hypothetical protein B0T18DRAFT_333017 [Schizothecium vesticola]